MNDCAHQAELLFKNMAISSLDGQLFMATQRRQRVLLLNEADAAWLGLSASTGIAL